MKNIGKIGEEAASIYLKEKGYKIQERNYRTSFGEIDIICEHQNSIIFIEVKTRRSNKYGCPEEAITINKQRKIIMNALSYLTRYHLGKKNSRFDVLVVSISDNCTIKNIKHIENAFYFDYDNNPFNHQKI